MSDRTVDELLHDAEHADGGLYMAGVMGDVPSMNELKAKRDRLLREALALDPGMIDDAWSECDNALYDHAIRLKKEPRP